MARRFLGLAALAVLAAGCGGSAAKPPAPAKPRRPTLRRIGSLPQAIAKAAVVALPHGKIMLLGGLVGNTSIDTILAGPPDKLRVIGHLPQPTHDAAAALVGGSVYLFGGGSSVSTPDVVRIDPATGTATSAPGLGEPLSDLGAGTVGGKPYLVGGFTGAEFATAILRYAPSGTTVAARLPHGTRYAGVTALKKTIYVAGGLTTSGPTNAVYAFSPVPGIVQLPSLPRPEAHAGLAALHQILYLVGGRTVIAIALKKDRMTVVARLPVSLSDPSVVAVGNEIVIAGGGTNGIWAFRP